MQYVCYVRHKYRRNCCIIFDGYAQGPSIKHHEHLRRRTKSCANIQVKETLEAHHSQQTFFSNEKNKSQFVKLLCIYLEKDGHEVHVGNGDADTLIVMCALELSRQRNNVVVISDDTGVFVLLTFQ
jgi:5'-3' exonuclease